MNMTLYTAEATACQETANKPGDHQHLLRLVPVDQGPKKHRSGSTPNGQHSCLASWRTSARLWFSEETALVFSIHDELTQVL